MLCVVCDPVGGSCVLCFHTTTAYWITHISHPVEKRNIRSTECCLEFLLCIRKEKQQSVMIHLYESQEYSYKIYYSRFRDRNRL